MLNKECVVEFFRDNQIDIDILCQMIVRSLELGYTLLSQIFYLHLIIRKSGNFSQKIRK